MPCTHLQVDANVGLRLDLGISSPASLLPPNSPAPPIFWFRAIADTGCTHTSIHSSVATKCGLNVISKGTARTPGANVAVNIYHADLFIRSLFNWMTPYDWKFADRGLMEMVNANPDFDALLGMDILGLGTLTTTGLVRATFCW